MNTKPKKRSLDIWPWVPLVNGVLFRSSVFRSSIISPCLSTIIDCTPLSLFAWRKSCKLLGLLPFVIVRLQRSFTSCASSYFAQVWSRRQFHLVGVCHFMAYCSSVLYGFLYFFQNVMKSSLPRPIVEISSLLDVFAQSHVSGSVFMSSGTIKRNQVNIQSMVLFYLDFLYLCPGLTLLVTPRIGRLADLTMLTRGDVNRTSNPKQVACKSGY